MQPIKITRPTFPPGYVGRLKKQLAWETVAAMLAGSKHYWLCSVRPDGRPHCVPRWGVFMDGKFYYDGSPETRHAQNILHNPHVSLHLESGREAVILEGTSAPAGTPPAELAQRLAAIYREKYAEMGYAPSADQWEAGGLYVFTPRQCIAWKAFNQDPTKFLFE